MGFVVTTLIFAMVGVIASLMVRICCGRGASANLYVLHALLLLLSLPFIPKCKTLSYEFKAFIFLILFPVVNSIVEWK